MPWSDWGDRRGGDAQADEGGSSSRASIDLSDFYYLPQDRKKTLIDLICCDDDPPELSNAELGIFFILRRWFERIELAALESGSAILLNWCKLGRLFSVSGAVQDLS